jgi:SAM-dependent methyltransferase
MHCSRRKDGSWSVRTKKLEQSLSQDIVHNRKKAYLLQEGEPIDALIELGIQSKNGKIIHSSYAKFIQINRFLELVSDVLPSKKTLHIVDFGSGKAYLSFMLYHVLSKQYDVHMIGIEQNEELVTKSNLLAQKLRFSNLRFEHASIDTCTLQNSIDIALALHACDTATDQAILQAMKYHAAVILCAPCCQHELAQQIDPKTLPLFFKHNLLRERYAALLTDALRVRFLELHGYKTQVIEFVDPEHSPKNLLIRAVRTGKKPSEEEMNEYTKTIEQLKIRPFLCRNTLSTPARR